MKMIDELKPMFLYSSNQKIYAPIDENDKRHGSAILLLSPSIDESANLTKLSYIHNPNLFVSYYIDRNVMGYINTSDFEELDEVKEKEISEGAFINAIDDVINMKNIKFTIDDSATFVDRSYLYNVFKNKTAFTLINALELNKIPKSATIYVHHTLSDLRDGAPKYIENIYHEKNYGYFFGNDIHVLSKVAYDQDTMCGDYSLYLKTELYNFIIISSNPNIDYTLSKGLSLYYSGQYNWLKSNPDNNCNILKNEKFFAKVADKVIKDGQHKILIDFIRTNDIAGLKKFTSDNALGNIRKMVFEADLSAEKRNNLSDDEFGIPSRRAYPLNDEEHVRQAIKMFNYCDSDEEKELAEAIIKKMKKFKINDVSVSSKNRFSKYYNYPKNESTLIDENIERNEKFEDVQKVCSSLEEDELKRITFTDSYTDSEFVIMRIINYADNGEPAGFLDVYQFPTRPEIAQIVIAVNSNYRGQGIARKMVEELLSSNLASRYEFEMYYWTAHQDNYASQNLALSSGFIDTERIDSYGRKIFIKRVAENSYSFVKEAKIHHSSTSIINENGSIFLLEADTNSQKIRQYLYRDRLRTSKDVLELYKNVKVLNPSIQKTYLELNMYKGFNLFVDLYYYHRLFLQNNTFRLDKGINLYLEFLNNLMNVNLPGYKKKTIFIPVDYSSWKITPNSDVGDYKVNLNPISLINRLVRTNPEALRRVFGNKNILFVGRRGYFKVDFSKFDLKDLNRFNINIEKLMSSSTPIVDDFENDEETDTKRALAARTIDKIEQEKNITVNNISKISSSKPIDNAPAHLRISTTSMNIEKHKFADKDLAIINIDNSGVGNLDILKKSPVYRDRLADVYCAPKE